MKTIILSGVGGSSNWLPFLDPLVAVIVIAYSVDFATRYFKRRKLQRENSIINDLTGHFEDVNGYVENNN